MTATLLYRCSLRTFEFLRRSGLYRSEERDESAWRRLPFMRGRQAIVRNRFGQNLCVRPDSLGDLTAAFGRREEQGVTAILGNLPPGSIVLDIGAHIGGMSLVAAKAVGSGGRVFAFEPVAENTRLLKQNALLNGIDWIVPIQAAVGRKSGTMDLLVSDTDTMWATSRRTWADVLHHGGAPAHTTSEQVPVVTVDDFVRDQAIKNITLMKVDVEAAEMDVLAGAAETLQEGKVDQLLIEVHSPTVRLKDVVPIIEGYGYRVSEIGSGEIHAILSQPTASRHGERARNRKPVTVALIGCGAVSERLYSRALDQLVGEGLVEMLALVDPSKERRMALSTSLPAAQHHADLASMLKETTPELAIIAAPHKFHADFSVQCLRNGMHVLCEKPMAMTTSECDTMIAAAEKAGRLLAVGHFRRFYPSCELIKRILDSEILGQVGSFDFYEGQSYGWPVQSSFPFKKAEAGGGVLIDQGAHAINLLMWWLGEPLEIAYQDDAMGGVELNCRLDITMPNGSVGVLQLSRDWPMANRCVIRCEKGWIGYMCDVMDRIQWGLYDSGYGLNAQLRRIPVLKEIFPDMSDAAPNDLDMYFTSQLRNVVGAVRGREPVRVSGVDARKTIAVIENCYRNRTLLHMPWLDEAELRRARQMAHAS